MKGVDDDTAKPSVPLNVAVKLWSPADKDASRKPAQNVDVNYQLKCGGVCTQQL